MKEMLAGLPSLNGDKSVIAKARKVLSGADKSVQDAIDYLEKTAELMWQRFGDIKVHFDLSELHGYHYKTGVVFAAFVEQLGQAIARGGRYDDIGEIFGRSRPATGFSTDLKILNQLSKKQFAARDKIFAPVVNEADNAAALKAAITELRLAGEVVIEQLPNEQADAKAMGCNKNLCLIEGKWQVQNT